MLRGNLLRRFITFEGGEGAGKSTQAQRLAERLVDAGHGVVVTREPGGTDFAERLRAAILAGDGAPADPLATALAFYAARADHLAQVVRPALSRGKWVVCDRFNDSTRVYQGAASGVPDDKLDVLDHLVVDETRPELTFVLDLPAQLGLERASARRSEASADRFEQQSLAFHERLRTGFKALTQTQPHRCVLIDAGREVDVISQEIWQRTLAHFQLSTDGH